MKLKDELLKIVVRLDKAGIDSNRCGMLDIVDELREFALELRDSTRLGPIEKPVMTAANSDNQNQKPLHY